MSSTTVEVRAGNTVEYHTTHDYDVFDHELTTNCPCGPVTDAGAVKELGMTAVFVLHVILEEES